MSEVQMPYEAEIISVLPGELANVIGNVMVSYAHLEHKLTWLTGLLLQMSRQEVHITLMRSASAESRLDMALDHFAIKGIAVGADVQAIKGAIKEASGQRNLLAHSIWLRDRSGRLFLQNTHGLWPKGLSEGQKISRKIFPQSLPYTVAECKEALEKIAKAMSMVDLLGTEIDKALKAYPEKFRPPLTVYNPLGTRSRS